jgi:uncharacterized protein YkwD
MSRSRVVALASLALSCGGASAAEPSVDHPAAAGVAAATGSQPHPASKLLTTSEARRYLLDLINRDRASMGLPAVALDEGPAQAAGQRHARDMAENGYLGHWGLDGSVPEQRHTEAGGADMVLENASCFVDGRHRTVDTEPRIDAAEIEKTESMFFHETPPNDGHRKNILKPWHTKVGLGIAQPRATPTEIPVPCVSEEFVDSYGSFGAVPREAHVGDVIHVTGASRDPAKVVGVGLARVDAPQPLTVSDANARRSYPVPQPYATYWPPGYVTPIPLAVSGHKFAIDLPLSDHGKPGMYEVSVWAKLPSSNDFQIVSLRTIRVVARQD